MKAKLVEIHEDDAYYPNRADLLGAVGKIISVAYPRSPAYEGYKFIVFLPDSPELQENYGRANGVIQFLAVKYEEVGR